MRRFQNVLLAFVLCGWCCHRTAEAATSKCGAERWAVKTGQDAPVFASWLLQETTVSQLRTLRPPDHIHSFKGRVKGVEDRVFQVDASIAYIKHEADGDYHVVLVDESGESMIAEFPDPRCVGKSPWKSQVTAVRARIEALDLRMNAQIPPPSRLHCRVTGVGFFDFIHGQTGHAPNGIELHPVLSLEVLK